MIVKMFQPRFAEEVKSKQKRQTIRPLPKRECDRPRVGQEISLRQWEGRPYGSKQEILAESTVTEVNRVEIRPNAVFIDGILLTRPQEKNLAAADGFNTVEDMIAWFKETHGLPFNGILTKWA